MYIFFKSFGYKSEDFFVTKINIFCQKCQFKKNKILYFNIKYKKILGGYYDINRNDING